MNYHIYLILNGRELLAKATKRNIMKYDLKALNDFAKINTYVTREMLVESPSMQKELSKIAADRGFIPHALALLSAVQPVGNSLADTYLSAKEAYTIEGKAVIKEEIHDVIKFFRNYSFSQFSKVVQTKSTINAGTPLVLYAQRLYNDRPYNSWDRTNIGGFLGRSLMDITSVVFPELEEEEYEQCRIQSVTATDFTRHEFKSYKANKTDNVEVNSLPRFFKHMYLKTWIFAEPKSSMIINIKDWDSAPEAVTPRFDTGLPF